MRRLCSHIPFISGMGTIISFILLFSSAEGQGYEVAGRAFDETGKKYLIKGKYQVINHNTIKITELPIGKWLMTNGKEFKQQLADLKGKYMADDLIGSKQYKGNLQRLKKELKGVPLEVLLFRGPQAKG